MPASSTTNRSPRLHPLPRRCPRSSGVNAARNRAVFIAGTPSSARLRVAISVVARPEHPPADPLRPHLRPARRRCRTCRCRPGRSARPRPARTTRSRPPRRPGPRPTPPRRARRAAAPAPARRSAARSAAAPRSRSAPPRPAAPRWRTARRCAAGRSLRPSCGRRSSAGTSTGSGAVNNATPHALPGATASRASASRYAGRATPAASAGSGPTRRSIAATRFPTVQVAYSCCTSATAAASSARALLGDRRVQPQPGHHVGVTGHRRGLGGVGHRLQRGHQPRRPVAPATPGGHRGRPGHRPPWACGWPWPRRAGSPCAPPRPAPARSAPRTGRSAPRPSPGSGRGGWTPPRTAPGPPRRSRGPSRPGGRRTPPPGSRTSSSSSARSYAAAIASFTGANPRPSSARITPSDRVRNRLSTPTWVCSCGSDSRLVECRHPVHTSPSPASYRPTDRPSAVRP